MITMGVLTFLGLILLLLKLSPGTLKRLVGANFAVDLVMTVGFVLLFAATGTFAGMMTGIIAGLMLSVFLLVAKWVFPHKKLERKGWKLTWTEQKPAISRWTTATRWKFWKRSKKQASTCANGRKQRPRNIPVRQLGT
jgi:MFS superfamily sulfate permease-like transporter